MQQAGSGSGPKEGHHHPSATVSRLYPHTSTDTHTHTHTNRHTYTRLHTSISPIHVGYNEGQTLVQGTKTKDTQKSSLSAVEGGNVSLTRTLRETARKHCKYHYYLTCLHTCEQFYRNAKELCW